MDRMDTDAMRREMLKYIAGYLSVSGKCCKFVAETRIKAYQYGNNRETEAGLPQAHTLRHAEF